MPWKVPHLSHPLILHIKCSSLRKQTISFLSIQQIDFLFF